MSKKRKGTTKLQALLIIVDDLVHIQAVWIRERVHREATERLARDIARRPVRLTWQDYFLPRNEHKQYSKTTPERDPFHAHNQALSKAPFARKPPPKPKHPARGKGKAKAAS